MCSSESRSFWNVLELCRRGVASVNHGLVGKPCRVLDQLQGCAQVSVETSRTFRSFIEVARCLGGQLPTVDQPVDYAEIWITFEDVLKCV